MEDQPKPVEQPATNPGPQPATAPSPQPTPAETNPQPTPVNTGLPASWLPTGNKPALIGYYLGIAGLLPFIGLPFAVAAIVLGIIGLKRDKMTKVAGAKTHAIVAIVLGCIPLALVALFFIFAAIGSDTPT